MALAENISRVGNVKQTIRFNFIHTINERIQKEKENAFGISIALITIGTMVASINAAFSIHGEISYFILAISLILAMGTNAAIISQQSFKFVVWAFIFNVTINALLIIYQISDYIVLGLY